MRPWAKIAAKISEDEVVAELLEKNPLSVALFLMSLPHADIWGILPAKVQLFHSRVCPAAEISNRKIKNAIDLLVECGIYHKYEANGKELLYIRHYHRYQSVRIDRVGRPDYPLPDCWDGPPQMLQKVYGKSSIADISAQDEFKTSKNEGNFPDQSRTTPGLLPDQNGKTADNPGVVPDYSRTTPGLLPDYSRTSPAERRGEERRGREIEGEERTERESTPLLECILAITRASARAVHPP